MLGAIEAEEQGSDAFALTTLPEPSLQDVRSVVDIPVVGYGESAMLAATMLGPRAGVLLFIREMSATILRNVDRMRLDARFVGAHDVGFGFNDVLTAYAGDPATLIERFRTAAREIIARGADVIIPGEAPLCLLLAQHGVTEVDGVPVLDALAAPGRLTYASASIGSFAHRSGELFKARAGIDLTHVPYRGTVPAATDIIGGRVDVMFGNYPSVQGQLKSEQFQILAIGASRRSTLLPGIPTVAEADVPGYESTPWFGLFARSATPPAAVATLDAAINAGLTDPAVAARHASLGVEPAGGTPEPFRAYVARRLEETGKLIRKANIRID